MEVAVQQYEGASTIANMFRIPFTGLRTVIDMRENMPVCPLVLSLTASAVSSINNYERLEFLG
jgi:hypothetical protein